MTPSREPDPRLFVELLFEVVIYEFEAIRQEIHHIVLSKVFGAFVEVSEEYQDNLACPCHDFIRDSDLLVENGSAWSYFISSFEPRLLPRFRPLRASEDHYFGYRITESGIDVPTWSPRLRHHFERRYDVFVPSEWKDDVAVFIHQLRRNLSIRGSGGMLTSCIQGRAKGVQKFSSRGMNQRTPDGEKLVLFAQEQEAIQKEQEAIQKRQQNTDVKKQQEETIRNERLLAEKKLFLSFYCELVIFELAATCGIGAKVVPVDRVSDAFAFAAKVLEKNSAIMFPCSSFIYSEGLQDPLRVIDFMRKHRPPWTIMSTTTVMNWSSREKSARVFEFAYNNRSRAAVALPTLSGEDERAFLEAYDTTVPYSFKDDLAILVCELQNRLTFRGSGGQVSTLHGGLQGVTKFMDTDTDVTARYILEQHDQERRQRLEQQEAERLEQDRGQKQSKEPSGDA